MNSNSDIAYLEITTRSGSGNGPFMKKTPGIYLYKPLFFSMPKQFYRPRNLSKQKDSTTDARSTIHWEPNVITDTNGKAIISFYSSDKAGAYTVTIEGADMNRGVGSILKKLRLTFSWTLAVFQKRFYLVLNRV